MLVVIGFPSCQLPGVTVRGAPEASLARDLGRDPLRDLARGTVVQVDQILRLAQQVDESRRHNQACRVDPANSGRVSQRPHRRDTVAAYAHVAQKCRRAGAIDDSATRKQDVAIRLRSGSLAAARDRHEGRQDVSDRATQALHGGSFR